MVGEITNHGRREDSPWLTSERGEGQSPVPKDFAGEIPGEADEDLDLTGTPLRRAMGSSPNLGQLFSAKLTSGLVVDDSPRPLFDYDYQLLEEFRNEVRHQDIGNASEAYKGGQVQPGASQEDRASLAAVRGPEGPMHAAMQQRQWPGALVYPPSRMDYPGHWMSTAVSVAGGSREAGDPWREDTTTQMSRPTIPASCPTPRGRKRPSVDGSTTHDWGRSDPKATDARPKSSVPIPDRIAEAMEGHESAVAAPSTDLPQDEAGVSGHDIRRVSETEWFAEIRAMSAQRRRLMDPPSGPSAEDIQREKERKGERARAGVEDLEVLQEIVNRLEVSEEEIERWAREVGATSEHPGVPPVNLPQSKRRTIGLVHRKRGQQWCIQLWFRTRTHTLNATPFEKLCNAARARDRIVLHLRGSAECLEKHVLNFPLELSLHLAKLREMGLLHPSDAAPRTQRQSWAA